MSYSQGGEEAVILTSVKGVSHGRLLDIGAYDGCLFSNSLRLIELGWSGLLIEPSPRAFGALSGRHLGNPAVRLLQAAVGFETKEVRFFDTDDAVGTTEQAHADKWASQASYREIMVPMISIHDLLNEFGDNFDFVNVDIEGNSAELFIHWPMQRCKPRVFCVEHDNRSIEMSNHGRAFGYEPRYLDGNNLILVRA